MKREKLILSASLVITFFVIFDTFFGLKVLYKNYNNDIELLKNKVNEFASKFDLSPGCISSIQARYSHKGATSKYEDKDTDKTTTGSSCKQSSSMLRAKRS